MTGEKGETRVPVGRAAWRACGAHGGAVAGLMLGQLLLRAAAFAPAYLFGRLEADSLAEAPAWLRGLWGALPAWTGWALTGLIFLLAVFPLRFWAGERLRYYSAPHQPLWKGGGAYAAWLRAGLLRCGRGLIWGLPFCAGLLFFLYGMEYLPFTELGQIMQKFAQAVGGEPSVAKGLGVFAGITALFLLLFLWGWRRDMPMEYLPARSLGAMGTCRLAAKARLRGKGQLLSNTLWNVLLFLPALAGWAVVLLPYVREEVRIASNPLWTIQGIMTLLKQPLPAAQLGGLMAVLLLLYLPLCALRKMRNAVLTRRLTREWNREEDGRAAG